MYPQKLKNLKLLVKLKLRRKSLRKKLKKIERSKLNKRNKRLLFNTKITKLKSIIKRKNKSRNFRKRWNNWDKRLSKKEGKSFNKRRKTKMMLILITVHLIPSPMLSQEWLRKAVIWRSKRLLIGHLCNSEMMNHWQVLKSMLVIVLLKFHLVLKILKLMMHLLLLLKKLHKLLLRKPLKSKQHKQKVNLKLKQPLWKLQLKLPLNKNNNNQFKQLSKFHPIRKLKLLSQVESEVTVMRWNKQQPSLLKCRLIWRLTLQQSKTKENNKNSLSNNKIATIQQLNSKD